MDEKKKILVFLLFVQTTQKLKQNFIFLRRSFKIETLLLIRDRLQFFFWGGGLAPHGLVTNF